MAEYPEEIYEDPMYNGTTKLYKYRGVWLNNYLFKTREKIDRITNMKIRDSDVVVASTMKSGTTWMQEIVWKISCIKYPHLIQSETGEDSKKVILDKRYQLIEQLEDIESFTEFHLKPEPRFMKSHVPRHMLPKEFQEGRGKIIYISRDVRDVVVSYYHFVDFLSSFKYTGSPEDMCREYIKGTVMYGPWLDHVQEFWSHRQDNNVLFTKYEDLKKNPEKEILRVGEFLGVTLTPAQVDSIAGETSFESMKNNDAVNFSWFKKQGLAREDKAFIRKGITGDWKNFLSQEMSDTLDKQLLEPLRQCGLVFGDS